MPDVPVTLTPWFDAKDNPPANGVRVLVDPFGPARTRVFAYRSGLDDRYKMWSEPHDTLDPQPRVWCDPSPPDMSDPLGPLTIRDLKLACDALLYASGNPRHGILMIVDPEGCEESAARLRRTLERMNID